MLDLLKISLFVPFFILACGVQEKPYSRSKAIHEGVLLVEGERYDEALLYFEDLYARDPHEQVELAWASVYAARAGIQTHRLLLLSKRIGELPPVRVQNAFDLFLLLRDFDQVWSEVPMASLEGQKDLEAAVKILRSKSPGVRLYAAVLRGIHLRGVLEHGASPWLQLNKAQWCQQDLRKLTQWSSGLLEELDLIMEDLKTAFPSDVKSYEEKQTQIQQGQRQLQHLIAESSLLCL